MKHFLFVIIFLSSRLLFAQDRFYEDPLKVPLFLSGSFAELRSNHFHSGIDIKTQGTTGLPVYAVADGFVSRVVVSPGGFGKALYVQHHNGTTSVYGHLNSFREDIEKFIKNIQYDKQSFRMDAAVSPDVFPVLKGELIAKSGNTGSSAGPHLHFEIRDTETEDPLNPLKYNFSVSDATPPKIFALLITPLSENAHVNYRTEYSVFPVVSCEGNYQIENNPVIPVYGNIGFALETNDFIDGSLNKCGINSLQLTIDGELWFSYRTDRFSFDDTRYINSHILYDEYIRSNRRFQKSWLDPGNKLDIYDYIRENGIYDMNDGNIHQVALVVADTYGNVAKLAFRVESRNMNFTPEKKVFTEYFPFNQTHSYQNDNLRLVIPEGSLYTDLAFTCHEGKRVPGFFSSVHTVHSKNVPLHKSATLELKVDDMDEKLQEKTIVVDIDTITGRYFAVGGNYCSGWISAEINAFGNYTVAVDTVSPVIVPLSIENKYTLKESNRLRFKISDNLSGIDKINGFIDDKWALFEYDAKTSTITHYFDSERFEMKKRHNFRLSVADYKGNETVYEATFWK